MDKLGRGRQGLWGRRLWLGGLEGKKSNQIRDKLPIPDRLAALAKIISADIGVPLSFQHRVVRRPCIILRGKAVLGPSNRNGIHLVTLTVEPLSQTELKRWIAGDRPEGCAIKGVLEDAARFLDAPFFGAEYSNDYIVGADARLNRNDPEYLAKLMKVLNNVKKQIGGEWLIEDRDIDVWETVVSQ